MKIDKCVIETFVNKNHVGKLVVYTRRRQKNIYRIKKK